MAPSSIVWRSGGPGEIAPRQPFDERRTRYRSTPHQRPAELRCDEIEHLATRAARAILALTHIASPHARPCLQKDLPLHDRGPQQRAGYRLTITRTHGPASDQPGPPGAEMIIAQTRPATLGGRGLIGRKRAAQHGLCNAFRTCHQHGPLVRREMDARLISGAQSLALACSGDDRPRRGYGLSAGSAWACLRGWHRWRDPCGCGGS
jgi:hypothetical protein